METKENLNPIEFLPADKIWTYYLKTFVQQVSNYGLFIHSYLYPIWVRNDQ